MFSILYLKAEKYKMLFRKIPIKKFKNIKKILDTWKILSCGPMCVHINVRNYIEKYLLWGLYTCSVQGTVKWPKKEPQTAL